MCARRFSPVARRTPAWCLLDRYPLPDISIRCIDAAPVAATLAATIRRLVPDLVYATPPTGGGLRGQGAPLRTPTNGPQ